jgi:MFS family permease
MARPALGLQIDLGDVFAQHAHAQQLHPAEFSEDEFFQLTFVNEPLPTFFTQFVRLDQHPFFHFLQLKWWSLISAADGWMLGNSLVWHVFGCAVLFFVGRAWQGAGAGLLAAAIYALLPQVVGASAQLRMYAMIPGLAVLVWWLNLRLLSGSETRRWVWWALAGCVVALGYSHAIAFFFVFWLTLAAAVQVGLQDAAVAVPGVHRAAGAVWRKWLAVQAVLALLLLPLPVLAVLRIRMAQGPAEDGGNADPGNMLDHFGGMVVGWGLDWDAARLLGFAGFVLAIALGLWNRRTRWMTALVLIGPYATAWVVGLVFAPMFKTPVYSAMLVPFACLALVLGLTQFGRAGAAGAAALLAALALFVFPASDHLNRADHAYEPVARALAAQAQPGDVVVIPKPYLYWATLRYAVGPDWGSALDVMPAPNSGWQRVAKMLGPDVVRWVKFEPQTQQVQHRGVTYVIGADAQQATVAAKRVWWVQRPRYPETPRLASGFDAAPALALQAGQPETLQLMRYDRAGAP